MTILRRYLRNILYVFVVLIGLGILTTSQVSAQDLTTRLSQFLYNFLANVGLTADAANIAAQRNGTTGQLFRIYDTYTDADNYSRFTVDGDNGRINMEAAGTGTQLALAFAIAGTTVATVRTNGALNLEPRAAAPTSPSSGDMYMDTTPAPDELCVYDGTGWQALITGTDANCA